jgi:hypothetical protein
MSSLLTVGLGLSSPPGALLTHGLGSTTSPSGTPPSGTNTAIEWPDTLYCSDEDMAIYLAEDFGALVPRSIVLSSGTNGVFGSGNRWLLISATANFINIPSRSVVLLGPEPKAQFGRVATGVPMAINSGSDGGLLLRRLGQPVGYGEPPSPAGGLSSVRFNVYTFRSIIAEYTKEANHRFGINPDIGGRKPSDMAPGSVEDLRTWCVLSVALWAYTMANKAEDSDYKLKVGLVAGRLKAVESRLQILWGPKGDAASQGFPAKCPH